MGKFSKSDTESIQHELNEYREIIKRYKNQLEADPWLAKQISFWMESTRFLITELEVWDRLGDSIKHDRTVKKIQRVKHQLHTLILHLITS